MSDADVARTLLDSGVRVVAERMPAAGAATTGFYVGVGARDESEDLLGASHFLEHLLFKGTADRTARQIAQAVDAVGGEMNAYTAREHTAFYTRLPAREQALGLEILGEVLANPALRREEIDAEREVILEEILMSEDDPDDVVHTALWEALFPHHPVGREVLGTSASIEGMQRDAIVEFHSGWYGPANLIVAAAGDLNHDAVVAAVVERFGDGTTCHRTDRHPPAAGAEPRVVVTRPTEQVHLALGWRGLCHDDDDRYALSVANHVLGGGASSRLFQEIREERGLVYTVGSATSSYSDCGAMTIYAGTGPKHLAEVLSLTRQIIEDLLVDGITAEEHRVALGYLEGSMVLGLEDSGSRMARLANSELIRGRVIPLDEHLGKIRAVAPEDVSRVLRRVFDQPATLAAVGPFDSDDERLTFD